MPKFDSVAKNGATRTKYSKSSEFYLNSKKTFFESNQKLMQEVIAQNLFYKEQPTRDKCKVCLMTLGDNIDFTSHFIEYLFCGNCGHLNGRHEDTEEFTQKLYIDDGGSKYSAVYMDEDFARRTSELYLPKVEFLLENIPASTECTLLDVGCGAGYFVNACHQNGLRATGIDVNDTMVRFGNSHISKISGDSPLSSCTESHFFGHVSDTTATIISAIGVIEHLREPHKLIEAFNNSKSTYLFYSVPMFSASVIFENVFENVFPRHLSGGHTHLFTESSVVKLNELFGVEAIAEWRFGTDVMDLYRSLLSNLNKNGASSRLLSFFETGFASKIDELQAVLDKHHFCSEIHCLTKNIKRK